MGDFTVQIKVKLLKFVIHSPKKVFQKIVIKNGFIAKYILERNDNRTDLSLDARSTTAFRSSTREYCDIKNIIGPLSLFAIYVVVNRGSNFKRTGLALVL